MVASRKILAGETIFLEPSALAVAPSPNSGPQCILCRIKVRLPSNCVYAIFKGEKIFAVD